MTKIDKNIALYLYLLCASVYLLSKSSSLLAIDGRIRFALTESLVERYSVSSYGTGLPAQSVLQIPLYLVGKTIKDVGCFQGRDNAREFFVGLLNSFITPISVVLLFAVSLKLGFQKRTALTLALLFAFATTAFLYARFNGNEPTLCLFLLGTYFAILNLKEKMSWRNVLFLAGMLFSLILSHYGIIPVALAAGLLVILKRKDLSLKKIHQIAIIAIMIGALFLCAWYNHARYSSFWLTGYESQKFSTPTFIGICGLLFSPGKSVFLYDPLILLSLFWFGKFFRTKKDVWSIYFIIIIPLYRLMVYAHWHSAFGSFTWGSRRFLPVLPFLLLPFGVAVEKYFSLKRWKKILIIAVIVLSTLIQLLAISVHWKYYWISIGPDRWWPYLRRIFSFTDGPLVGQVRILIEAFSRPEYFDFFWISQFQAHPLVVSGALIALFSVMAVSILGLKKSFRAN